MAKLRVQQSADGTMIADVSVNEYLEHKREYLHESDYLKVSGQVKSEDLAGLFQYKDRLSKSRVKVLDITGLVADEPALSVAGMFKNNRNLEEIRGLGSLVRAVENSKDMQEMFAGCESLKALDLSMWSPKKVDTMESMFEGCSSLNSVNFNRIDEDGRLTSGWHGAKNMAKMFKKCTSLDKLQVGGFDLMRNASVNDVADFASGCDKLAEVKLPAMTRGAMGRRMISREDMFYGCSSLTCLSGGTEKMQEDQSTFYQGYLRNNMGYSYEQALLWADALKTSELSVLRVARMEDSLQNSLQQEKEKQTRLRKFAHGGRGEEAEQLFGHIGQSNNGADFQLEE